VGFLAALKTSWGPRSRGKTEVPHRAEQPLRTDPRAVMTACFGSAPGAMTQPDQSAGLAQD
jgi:hypothetical protein